MHIHAAAPSGTLITIDGQWELLSLVGKGSFAKAASQLQHSVLFCFVAQTQATLAAVYKAKNTSTGQLAAIKAIAADKIAQEKILLALQSEINILRSVVHPNIVKLLDYHRLQHDPEGRPSLTHYLVLEYCDGGDLADFLESRKRTGSRGLDEDTTRRLLRMLAMGLREMHSRNIVHGAHVSVKIADFGFARALEPAHLASTLCGSPLYMAPEVLSEQQYDSRSDLWSVGVMMFEMLVGHVPFSGNNIVHLKKVIDSNEAFLPFDRREQLSPACQDLVKRLLQKDPNSRLSFSAFFAHPFLSGQPLHNVKALPETPEIYVEEPSSSAIEEDYVILSIPAPPSKQQARGRHAVQAQFEAHGTGMLSDADPILAAHATSLPSTLSHPQWLYVTAMCISELADWKLVNSIPAAAVHLSMLSVHLHDRVLSLLVPSFVQTQASDVSSDLAPGPHSPCYLTTAPTDDSDSEAHPAYYWGQSQPHSHGTADPHAAGLDSCPSSSHRFGLGGEPQAWGPDDKALGVLLRCVAKQDEIMCRWAFARLRGMLQRTSELTADLLNRQGMLSFASSAALDEMFGAHASAAKGYAKAATLAELLQRQAADSKASPRGQAREMGAHQGTQGSAGTRMTGMSGGSSAGEGGLPCSPSFDQQVTDPQNTVTQNRLRHHSSHLRRDQEVAGSRLDQSSDQGHAQGSLVTSGSGACGLMFPDDLQENQSGPANQLAGWGWVLDHQQQQQLQAYINTLSKRHSACLRPRS